MSTLVEAAPGLLLVLGLPGVLVLLIARVRLSWVQALGAIPVCSIGAVWLLAELCLITGLPFAPVAFWVLVVGLAVAAVVTFVRAGRRFPELVLDADDAPDLEPSPARPASGQDRLRVWIALGLLVASVVLGASIWMRGGIAGPSLTPPYPDAANHGFMVARIMRTESIASHDILVSDLRFGTTGAGYYPLAMHAPLALAARITGASVASLLIGISVLFGAFVLPLGLFALTRMLVPDLPIAAGFAAIFSQLISSFPYKPYTWGGLTTIVAAAALPIVLVLVLQAVTSGGSRRAMGLSVLLLMTVFSLYISVFVFLVFLLGLLLLERAWIARSVRWLTPPIKRLAIIGGLAVILALPVVIGLTTGVSERASTTTTGLQNFDIALGQVLTIAIFAQPASWLAGLAAIGIGVMLWRRRLAAWAVGTVVVVYLGVLASTSHGTISQTLTLPWYHQAERIVFYLVFFVPVFAAVLLALFCDAMSTVLQRRSVWLLAGSIVLVLVFVVAMFGRSAERANRRFLQAGSQGDALVGTRQIAAFNFLARHSPKRALVVVDDFVEEGQWMYAYAGVKPLWGVNPVGTLPELSSPEYSERLYLTQHLTSLGRNAKLERLVHKYDTHYVYFADRTVARRPHTWTLKQLRATPRLREVFRRPGAHVFEILPASAAAHT